MRWTWIAIALLAAWPAAGSAAKGRKAKGGEQLAILITATSEQAARDRMTRLIELTLYARILGYEGVPRVYAPGELPLSDGPAGEETWHVVLSVCSKKDATQRLASLKERVPDAVTAPVTGEYPDQCLGRRAFQPMSNQEKRYVQAIVDDPKAPNPRVFYAGFLQSETRFAEATRVLEEVLRQHPENEQARGLLQMGKMMERY